MGIAPMYIGFVPKILKIEATAGIAPAYKSFADSCLTTWLRGRLFINYNPSMSLRVVLSLSKDKFQSWHWPDVHFFQKFVLEFSPFLLN